MSDELVDGSTFAGFTVQDRVGRGGMSMVYRATDPALGRQVALKVMAPTLSADAGFRERFISEARAASHLDHPNVIPIYRAGEHDGRLFIAMRFVPGGADLRKLLRREGRLPAPLALGLLAQAAGALDAVHDAGMVHRDVKPDNLLLADPDDAGGLAHLYLTDFGLTRAASQQRLTQDGQVVGTLAYAPPEQIRGEEVGPGADVYSLGCVLFECLGGRRPFVRDNDAALMYAHLNDPPESLSSLVEGMPAGIDAVVARALAKDPGQRYGSCTELVTAAAAALGTALPDLDDDTPTISRPRIADPAPSTAAVAAAAAGAASTPPPPTTPPADEPLVATPAVATDGSPTPLPLSTPTDVGSGRNPWPLRIAAGLLVVVLLGVGLVALSRRSADDPFTFRFARTTHQPSGITVDRAWRLQGDNGDQVAGSIEIANPSGQARTYTHDEVIPKDLADRIDKVAFAPSYDEVVQVDPVVRYRVEVPAGSTTTLRWTVTVPPAGRDPQRLQTLAAAWQPAFDAYKATDKAKEADTFTAQSTSGPAELASAGSTEPSATASTDTTTAPTVSIDPSTSVTQPPEVPTSVVPTVNPTTGPTVTAGPVTTGTTVPVPKTAPTTAAPKPTAWNGQTCTVVGTAGNDRLVGTAGSDVLCGLGGDDTILPGSGDDIIDGGAGTDTVSYEDSPRPVSFNLAQQSAWWIVGYPDQNAVGGNWDQFGGTIENGRGSNGADVMVGRTSAERFEALGGDDFINAYNGADVIDAGAGNDTCYTDGYAIWTLLNCEKHS